MKLDKDQEKIINSKADNICVIAGAGSGKALVNSTQVLTSHGYKPINMLHIGEEVYDRFGNICYVEGIFPQGAKQVYKIEFDNGVKIDCCKDHLWFVLEDKQSKPVIRNTSYIERYVNSKNLYIPTISPNASIKKLVLSKLNECFKIEADEYLLLHTEDDFWCNPEVSEFIQVINSLDNFSISATIPSIRLGDLLKCLELLGFVCTLSYSSNFYLDKRGRFVNRQETTIDAQRLNRLKIQKAIKTKEFEEMTCIKVSSDDESFIINRGIVTHNTTVLTEKVIKTIEENPLAKVVCITFTNLAANEMKQRIFNSVGQVDHIFIGTIHSLANKILGNYSDIEYTLLTPLEEYKIAKKLIKDIDISQKDLDQYMKNKREISLGHYYRSQISQNIDSEIFCKLEFIFDTAKRNEAGNLYNYAALHNYITFDELISLCRKYLDTSSEGISIDYLFVDEFQDVGLNEKEFIFSLNPKYIFIVGDDYQCQPKGTKITMHDGSIKNIEDVAAEEFVLTYNVSTASYRKNKVLANQKSYTDKLINIYNNQTEITSYTPNHRCYVELTNEKLKDNYVMYIAINSLGQCKLGLTKLFKDNKLFTCSLSSDVDKIWMLTNFSYKNIGESAIRYYSRMYNIPLDFTNIESSSLNNCLDAFHRSVNYPIMKQDFNRFIVNELVELRACNIVPRLFKLRSLTDSILITSTNITRCSKGKKIEVYGLNIDYDHNYIGDNYLTGNSIYGFNGGSPEHLRKIVNDDKFTTYKLTNNYRSIPKIVNYSNNVINTQADLIPKKCVSKTKFNFGSIYTTYGDEWDVIDILLKCRNNLKDWFILCRTNDDLVSISHRLYYKDIPYTTFKQSELKDIAAINAKLIENSVKLLTIHAAKGLESKNIIIFGKFPIVKTKNKILEDVVLKSMLPEEVRIFYVAITRAKENIYLISTLEN